MPLEFDFTCPLPNGVHARPASAFEEIARGFAASIRILNRRTGSAANGKSVLSILGADIRLGDACQLSISGTDDAAALSVLSRFLIHDFPHCDDALPALSPTDPGAIPGLPESLASGGATIRAGTAVVGGIGCGVIVFTGGLRVPATIPMTGATDGAAEHRKIDAALAALVESYSERLTRPASSIEKALFQAHRAVARDPEFSARLHEALNPQGPTAAGAIVDTSAHFTAMLAESASVLLRERALDVQDVCGELLRTIHGAEATPAGLELTEAAIVVAETLTPCQFLRSNRRHLKGLVLGHAGTTSHTVILARSFGIPTLAGVANLAGARPGHEAIVDGNTGVLVTDLTEPVRRDYGRRIRRIAARREHQRRSAVRPGATRDGRRVEIGANISIAEEAAAAFAEGAEGIGLFRTEMLFLDRASAPGEEGQFENYRQALIAAGDRPVIIRMFDIGGDKPLSYLNLPPEENPFLGFRAARLYPAFEALFRVQVRALIRASAHGRLKVLIPMIATLDEARWVRRIVREEQTRCAVDGLAFDPAMPVGAMIEVPAAAFLLDALALELDFFSIGSNDLLQYFAAADRADARLAALQDWRQPAFLRLLRKIVDDAHAAGKWVGLCGEIGAQPECLPVLVGLGLDEISMAPSAVVPVKATLAGLDSTACDELTRSALRCATADEVRARVGTAAAQRAWPLVEPELIAVDVPCATRAEAIEHAADLLFALSRTEEPEAVAAAVMQREATYSTGFGYGFAIPHCKTDAIRVNSLVILKLRTPVDWGSLDHAPVSVVILMALRESAASSEHLKILARLARKVMDEEFRERLSSESDPAALSGFLKSSLAI